MFTWIVSHQAKILSVYKSIYTIQSPLDILPTIGQSIAHDGACMSITEIDTETNTYQFFAMQESLHKTNFTHKNPWDYFNLELCMMAWDRLDGHFVTGHIDTTGRVNQIDTQPDWSIKIHITFDPRRSKLILPKWSVAINGVSLTIVDTKADGLTVRLIPLTQSDTNLWSLQVWDTVNLEFDMLGKYVLKSQWVELPVYR